MVICSPCREGPNSINWTVTDAVPKRKPVKNYEICSSRLTRCQNRTANLNRVIKERTEER